MDQLLAHEEGHRRLPRAELSFRPPVPASLSLVRSRDDINHNNKKPNEYERRKDR